MTSVTTPTRGDLQSKIPLELIHQILIHSEKSTLCSTSLVCKSWLCISKPLLFESVHINAKKSFGQYTRTRKILFDNKNTRYIKHFSFDMGGMKTYLDFKTYDNMDSLVVDLESNIGATKKLSISYQTDDFFSLLGYAVPSRSQRVMDSICTTFSNITELEIRMVTEVFKHLLLFVRSFPRLEVLHVDCNKLHNSPYHERYVPNEKVSSMAPAECTFPEPLRTLSFRTTDLQSFSSDNLGLRWLASHPPRRNISHLSLHKSFVTKLTHFSQLCLATLTNLHLSVYDQESRRLSYAAINFPCDLSSLESLETFTVDMPFDGSTTFAMSAGSFFYACNRNPLSLGSVATLPNVLKTITSTNFRRLSFVAHSGSEFLPLSGISPDAGGSKDRTASWMILDELLSSSNDDRFADLVIEIFITCPDVQDLEGIDLYDWKRDAGDKVRRRFPRCDADGKLSVTFSMTGYR
ncbi:hypothetical protein L218DRAFT_1080231 [Marasmius fiardii PR-910]|nr:hypothetical protein L218DRAFT_1080231 [Marasmius fiardii PR-910]